MANLVENLLFHESRLALAIRRPLWRRFYGSACRKFVSKELTTFLNLGYLADPSELGVEDTAGIADRVSERLYDQIVGDIDLKGLTAVEVGCGPGGGSAHFASKHRPASFTGVDLSDDMIAWCREHYDLPNLRFQQGDAQDLPFESNSIDAVINLESSHCYPSRPLFFEEVTRVLRPGGAFLFADLMIADGDGKVSDAVSAWLNEAGLTIEDRTDITENVLAARDAVSRSGAFQSRMRESFSAVDMPLMEEAIALVGTQAYKRLASRQVRYMQWRASKPSVVPTSSNETETVGKAPAAS